MSYLDFNNLEISVDFGKGFYENLGVKKFNYSYIQLFDDEINYSLSGTKIQKLPILDVCVEHDGKSILQDNAIILTTEQPIEFSNNTISSSTINFIKNS